MKYSLDTLRRSTSKILACAFLDVFPGATLVRGDITEFGFYYDFVAQQPIEDQALAMLEEKMRGIIKESIDIQILDMMRENAASLFSHREQEIKAHLICHATGNIVSIFQMGNFFDDSIDDDVKNTQDIPAFCLLDIAKTTTYLVEEGPLHVTRIFGTACHTKEELKKFVKSYKSGKKKDHRVYSEKGELFSFVPVINSLAWCWDKKGVLLREKLLEWWRKIHLDQNFQLVSTPGLVRASLIENAGLDPKGQSPRCSIEDIEYVVPPALSASHAELFASKKASIQDLPLRFAECAQIANSAEKSQLWGVFASRLVLSDEAHIFCSPEHIEQEVISSLQFFDKFIKMFSFKVDWALVGHNRKTGSLPNGWSNAIKCFDAAFKHCEIVYQNELDEGIFTHLMLQARLVDLHGRCWKGPCLGIDFSLSKKLNISYLGKDQLKQSPVILVRSLFGSVDRFIALLLEHYSGRLPSWLCQEEA